MKIYVLFSEHQDRKCELNIFQFDKVYDIKKLIIKNLPENIKYDQRFLDIIYKSFILNKNYLINFYNISQNDEIYVGKLEKHLQSDDIIVEIFMAGWLNDWIYLILNKNDKISHIKSIMTKIIPKNVNLNIWNIIGEQMDNEIIVQEINFTKGYHKILISCIDNIDLTFDNCRGIHDRSLMERFWKDFENSWINYYNLLNENFDNLINDDFKEQIKTTVETFVDKNNKLFIDNTTKMPPCFRDTRLLFWEKMTMRCDFITNDFCDLLRNVENMKIFPIDQFNILEQYIRLAFRVAIMEYLDSRINQSQIDDKYHYSVDNHLSSLSIIAQNLMKLFFNRFLICQRTESEIDEYINDRYKSKFIYLRRNGSKIAWINISIDNINTIIQLKKTISYQTGISSQDLFLMDYGTNDLLKDENNYDQFQEYIVEIVCSMENIEIMRKIGFGSFGTILLCENKISRKPFALKTPKDSCDLCKEIIINSKLRNFTNMIRYKGIYRQDGNICMAMEYMPGGNLSEYIKERQIQLSELEIGIISYQILKQLEQLHENGIIHRDIKPDNIAFDKYGNVKLIDFGMFKYTGPLCHETQPNRGKCSQGSIYYTAPEFISGENSGSDKVDIWSLGAVIIEILTGNKPYHNLTTIQAILKITRERKIEYISREPISDALSHFINCCLIPNPIERPSAKQLIQSQFITKYSNKIQ